MEWVETTGKTVEEAKDAALDQLGVDDADAEFEVIEEPTTGLFGRQRGEARVRARVRPTSPRPKAERRTRKKAAAPAGAGAAAAEDENGGDGAASGDDERPRRAPRRESRPPREPREDRPPRAPRPAVAATDDEVAAVRTFLEGLVAAYGAEATVTFTTGEDDAIEAHVNGDDLGLLIGPKAQTLTAIQELARAVLQKDGPGGPRLRVDVGGYRERRRAALERFTQGVAEQVLASGTPTSMEPMAAADRKVVHDTVNTIDGVRTTSEGEEPRRRVVVLPDEG